MSAESLIKVDVLNDEVCSGLDRTETSHGTATFILGAAAKSLASHFCTNNVKIKMSLSKSTVRRRRNQNRKRAVASYDAAIENKSS